MTGYVDLGTACVWCGEPVLALVAVKGDQSFPILAHELCHERELDAYRQTIGEVRQLRAQVDVLGPECEALRDQLRDALGQVAKLGGVDWRR